MKQKYIEYYLKIAEETAKLSSARRLQVGTVIVKNGQAISTGYNGTFPGFDNNCETEDEVRVWDDEKFEYVWKSQLKTHDEVYHSEANAIYKLARSTESSADAAMFTTHACCKPCALAIAASGIAEFYYKHNYRDMAGIDFLTRAGVRVWHCEDE